MKTLMRLTLGGLIYAFGLGAFAGGAVAHDLGGAGMPVCLEGNFMVADATGFGRVLEMNVMTGQIGIIVDPPFGGPWKPTGVLSGGVNGHAFISSAAQHKITEFHRDGTPVRTITPITAPPPGPPFGQMPRLLGSQFMPNGNIIQAVCDAEFPPAYSRPASTPERAANSRLLVFDQGTLTEVDEYSKPDDDRWTCMAGIIFSEEGMYVSMFHGAAVFVIDWKAGLDEGSTGFGSNRTSDSRFHLGHKKNVAEVIRVIDMYPGAADDDPRRRDSLRAITLDSENTLYATNRARDGAEPRHHVTVVAYGADGPTGTIAMDHAVQVIAGIRTNRISGPGCEFVSDPGNAPVGFLPFPTAFADCDFETIYVASTSTGTVREYLIDPGYLDDADLDEADECRASNIGCAQPIAEFFGPGNGQDSIDPRMLMTIHEAFVQ